MMKKMNASISWVLFQFRNTIRPCTQVYLFLRDWEILMFSLYEFGVKNYKLASLCLLHFNVGIDLLVGNAPPHKIEKAMPFHGQFEHSLIPDHLPGCFLV